MKKQVNDSNLKTGLKVILAVVLAVFGVYMGILFITAFWPVVLVAGLVCVVVGGFIYFCRALGWTVNKAKGGNE